MTHASEWRLAYARRLAEEYAKLSGVSACFVGGSTARGHADRFSDIELTVLWHATPTEAERAGVVAALGGDLHRLYPYVADEGIWEDVFFLGHNQAGDWQSGCMVEISHYLQTTMAAAVDRVLVEYSTEQELNNMMAGIADGIPLLNAPLIASWQERLRRYPDGLQLALIQQHGIIDHFWRWEMLVARGDNRMELAAHFSAILRQTLHLILALNRVYYGGFKWINTLLPQLAIAPPDLAARIRQVYALPPAAAAAHVQSIVEQTFDLIALHVPAADVARFRQIFAFQRPQWDDAPPSHDPLTK